MRLYKLWLYPRKIGKLVVWRTFWIDSADVQNLVNCHLQELAYDVRDITCTILDRQCKRNTVTLPARLVPSNWWRRTKTGLHFALAPVHTRVHPCRIVNQEVQHTTS